MSESSEGSSSEVNLPVSSMEIEAEKREFAEGDETMENFDLEVQLEDLMISHDDASDKSMDTWKTGLELHEDENSIFSSFDNKFDNRYQVLAITEDNSEEFDENNNPVLNPSNINRGANHLAEGETADSLVNREKIRLSVDEWNIIKTAVEHCTPIPNNANRNMLFGYHYALRQQSKLLAKEKIEVQKRKVSPIATSDGARRARSDASYTNAKRHRRHGSSQRAREHYTKDTRSSTGGSPSIPAYNATKSRRPKGTHASGSTAGTKDGRQQVISKRGRSIP
jgi:hypothetical protein